MTLSPLNQRRWRNFRRNGRAFWSLVIFTLLFVASLLLNHFLPPGTSFDPARPDPSSSACAAIRYSDRSRSISCMMPFCTPKAASRASSVGAITSITALPMPIT